MLDQSDGFSLRPRIHVRFSGPVNTATLKDGIYIQGPSGRIPINEVVWDPATNTVFAKPDSILAQQTKYTLVITNAVKDHVWREHHRDPTHGSFTSTREGEATEVESTTFTTMSATAWLEHAREILPYLPTAVRFRNRKAASTRRHHAYRPEFSERRNPIRFGEVALPIESGLLAGIDRLVIGSYRSPRFLEDDQSIRPSPTLPGFAVPSNTHESRVQRNPSRTPKPAAGTRS